MSFPKQKYEHFYLYVHKYDNLNICMFVFICFGYIIYSIKNGVITICFFLITCIISFICIFTILVSFFSNIIIFYLTKWIPHIITIIFHQHSCLHFC